MSAQANSGESIMVRFKDKTGDGLSREDFSRLVSEMNEVAEKYGYGLDQWGAWITMAESARDELEVISRK